MDRHINLYSSRFKGDYFSILKDIRGSSEHRVALLPSLVTIRAGISRISVAAADRIRTSISITHGRIENIAVPLVETVIFSSDDVATELAFPTSSDYFQLMISPRIAKHP